MSGIYRALLLKHLKDCNDPHQIGIAEVKTELAAEEKTVILTNTLTYPLNDSVQTITLNNPRNTLDYWVEVEVLAADGNVGGIIVSNKQLSIFNVEFTGNATSVTIRCRIRGGIYLDLPPLGTDLDDCSWEQISKISEAGLATDYFSVGDCKAVHLQGTIGTLEVNATYYAFILGFDHNHEVEGKGITFGTFKTAKTGGVDIALVDNGYNASSTDGTKYFNMNHSENTNVSGWQGCDLRFDVLGSVDVDNAQNASPNTIINPVSNTLMAALPTDLKAIMKPIIKYTDNSGGSGNDPTKVTYTVDYLPILAEYEIFGVRTITNSAEQTYQQQYEYYRLGNNKLKNKISNALPIDYWERSADNRGSSSFCCVLTNGQNGIHSSFVSFGISSVFLV